VAAAEAPALFGALGGYNRKLASEPCQQLLSLVMQLWALCKHQVVEAIVVDAGRSSVVQRVSAFLSKALLAGTADDIESADAPSLSRAGRDNAQKLLLELLSLRGRTETRALQGAVPHLAGSAASGCCGFLTSTSPAARSIGTIIVDRLAADPSLVSAADVQNLLAGCQHILQVGGWESVAAEDVTMLSFEAYAGQGAIMRFANLDDWSTTEAAQDAASMLQVVSRALELRLLTHSRSSDRGDFEEAFHAAFGFFLVVPLLHAPPLFAEPALSCLATFAQAATENVGHIVTLSAVQPLLGLPSPERMPLATHVDEVLQASVAARRHMAKLLSRCVRTTEVVEMLQIAGDHSILRLARLINRLRQDGRESLEAFHDMIDVYFAISQHVPGRLCQFVPSDLMQLFVELSAGEVNEITERAQSIVQVLMHDQKCLKVLEPILQIHDNTLSYDVEEELIKLQQHGAMPISAVR